MGALARLIKNMLPNLLRLIILIFYSLMQHCKRLCSSHKYTSMINRKCSKFSYRKRGDKKIEEEHNCSICLLELGEGDEVREVVDCKHVFHCDCLEKWLRGYGPTCPLCRSLVVPEVVVKEYHRMQIEQQNDEVEKELAHIFFKILHGVEAALDTCTSRFRSFLSMFFNRCCID